METDFPARYSRGTGVNAALDEAMDIVEELRARVYCTGYIGQGEYGHAPDPLCASAANEIERLRSELETARDRFRLIKEGGEGAERALRLAIPDIEHALSIGALADGET